MAAAANLHREGVKAYLSGVLRIIACGSFNVSDGLDLFLLALQQISVGFQQVKLGERGGRRRDFNDAGINTRQAMEHVKDSKTGTSGSPIYLTANFFRIVSRPQWVLYQYHVDYNPPMESRRLRSALLFQHEEVLGSARSFDGSLLFLPNRLHSKETVLHSETRNGEKVQITVTLTNELPPTSSMCIQFYNILFRRLTIWPGYSTTILKYESSIMLCIDQSHKVLRSETVLDFMINLRHQFGNQRFPDICAKELIGLIVLTKYNNRTYRIDDIAWDHTPNNTFTRRDTEISFKNYYKNQYGLDITDDNQALLVSHMRRLGPAGAPPPGPAMLIPELCYLTGLTNKIRADFTIMKALDSHTKLSPEAREGGVNRFIHNIQRKDKYDTVKRFLCVECPTPSQCVVARTLRKALMSVGTKIALQVACKMGGELWCVEIPLKHVMIVGIDCYHDTTAGKRSIGALVASLNQNMSRWYSKCALKEYLKFNNCLPSRIIVYRDGVGDGQLHSVVNYEVSQIMDCIKSMGHDYILCEISNVPTLLLPCHKIIRTKLQFSCNLPVFDGAASSVGRRPKLSVVVVKKRLSTRFFARINGKVCNPPPGTVIDSEVTRPEWYDFYIVSQSVTFGCLSPSHYNVVYDTSGLKPDHMQRLTYKLCHMYYNWQGLIRVPAPCQYAHKLAFLVGQSIHRQPHVQLDNLLFYL
ncbi:Piwi-like protein 1 [Collichthys lucidus]|uniref:Piwi-like protein 1 n=1 Tax=Collichthys lucidus TaxID=240159 RepID=A0A4U5UUX7_COLLU|nr:Piwi-like protein 1 [Collichthys lucidus]